MARLEDTEFLYSGNADYALAQSQIFLQDPSAVDPHWRAYFETIHETLDEAVQRQEVRSWLKDSVRAVSPPDALTRADTIRSIRALMLIRAFRVRGHLMAQLDPLHLDAPKPHPELDPATYGFGAADWDIPIFIDGVLGFDTATLTQIMARLKASYGGTVGVEFMHIQDPDQKAWIQEKFENETWRARFTPDVRRAIFSMLMKAEIFEQFLGMKFPGAKRFGLDGGESAMPALEAMLERLVALGVRDVVYGMAHRGRLGTLVNILGWPLERIIAEFQGKTLLPDDVVGAGDVKYHLGGSGMRDVNGVSVHLSLTANPSHLEAVDPVVLGRVRARQDLLGDLERRRVAGILIHGDAAFAGQGLVSETLDLSDLHGYRTGGTVHLIINNQIGFTTSPTEGRSSPYSSDRAKAIQVPIFHVNGDDPEAVVYVSELAAEFRQKFQKDVVIDLYCYRRHGHNEADEPSFTQPHMYQVIGAHKTVLALYQEQLEAAGIVTPDVVAGIKQAVSQAFEDAFQKASQLEAEAPNWFRGTWGRMHMAPAGYFREAGLEESALSTPDTGVPRALLDTIAAALIRLPESFHLHPRLQRIFEAKATALKAGGPLDWATAEALAFGSLLAQNVRVRLSGQDSERGTFSQRHAVLKDQQDGGDYIPLDHLGVPQQSLDVVNSPLAEASVLGFEYGYSLSDPEMLVMWEAQFGDFSNGAQVIIDQFVASGETKWFRQSGLVMLLPHGYEGMGPEHTSARLERYLQLAAEGNMQVANCSTPANYFHILRRQLARPFRKPLVLMTPKSLLRHKEAVSTLKDLESGTHFEPVVQDGDVHPKDVRRVILCAGKVYYDLLEARRTAGQTDVALLRVEEFYPFPSGLLKTALVQYPKAEVVWVQEEPFNMGAWFFVSWRLEEILQELGRGRPGVISRPAAASPATGFYERHVREQQQLVQQALKI